jgi:hypothetical protein
VSNTYNEIVSAAMRRLGLTQAGEAPTGDEYGIGIEALNDLVSGWRIRGLEMSYTSVESSAGGDVSPFEDEDLDAVKALLAMRLAEEYGKMPSPMLAAAASTYWNALFGKYVTGPDMVTDSALLPRNTPGSSWPRNY